MMEILDLMREFAKRENVPIVKDDTAAFLRAFVQKKQVRDILEVGTAIGYSAMIMALSSRNVHVDTLEIDEESFLLARQFLRKAQMTQTITTYRMDAKDFWSEKRYDLIFIDGAKAQYAQHFAYLKKNLKKTGYFIFDNMEFHGMVDHPERTQNRHTKDLIRKLRDFRETLLQSREYRVEYFKDLGDGVMIVQLAE